MSTNPRLNQDSIPSEEPISARIPKENDYQNVEAGGHNKVRTQAPSESIPDNVPKVLPPGASIPSGAVKIDPSEGAAQRLADGVGSTSVGGSAESTLQGASSGDFQKSIGNPVGGVSSSEAHHAGGKTTDAQKISEPT